MIQLPTTPYLDRPRPRKRNGRFVGGTVIADQIQTVAQQAAVLADPDLVRPPCCPACRSPKLHVQERRARLLDSSGSARIDILIFRCAAKDCRAVWRVLPGFLARFLWRCWSSVIAALDAEHRRGGVPKRTRRRWQRRLRERSSMLALVLAQLGPRRPAAVTELGPGPMRGQLIAALGLAQLAKIASCVDRLVPGVRVM